MTLLTTPPSGGAAAPVPLEPPRRPGWLERRLGPAWPLKLLLLGFPLWWLLGLASFSFLIAATAMAVQMVRRGGVRLPAGFGVWLLFLAWMGAGVFMLWVDAPGTITEGGSERLVGYLFRVLWYLAVTVALLYPLSLPARVLPARQVYSWLGALLVVATFGGLAGLVAPAFELTTPAEWIIPGARGSGFIHEKVHLTLATPSDFLGYEQARPNAPFTFANAWGNNVGLLLPYFVYGWLITGKRWQQLTAPVVLVLVAIPIIFSLNRGLWLGLVVSALFAAVMLARRGHFAALWTLLAGLAVAAVVFMASPLADTLVSRLEHPHSNERRTTVAEVVLETTWDASPLLGYGTTRQVEGSFASIAGGATPECRQCAAPPLGTQGFMWRLVFTTGFVGTVLFLAFMAVQLVTHIRRLDAEAILGSMSIVVSMLFFLVYDSLESPLFLLMLAIGLMNRRRLDDEAVEAAMARGRAGPATVVPVRASSLPAGHPDVRSAP
ncbi:MAG: O-antigen ligase family protein [Actinomycetia bacterium]|jgi:hypothetical protein|nr:O-antigen ligase family protein [Actinomycetes bacterium]